MALVLLLKGAPVRADDPTKDPKIDGDPYKTLFVSRLVSCRPSLLPELAVGKFANYTVFFLLHHLLVLQ